MENGITVYITTRERYSCLNRVLLSLAGQKLQPERVIICNDNPPDQAVEFHDNLLVKEGLRVCSAYDIPVDIIDTGGIGTVKAKNKAWSMINTKWGLYVESDAFLPYNYISNLYDIAIGDIYIPSIRKRKIGGVAGCQLVFFDFSDFTDIDLTPQKLESAKLYQTITLRKNQSKRWVEFGKKHQVYRYDTSEIIPVQYFLHSYLLNTDVVKKLGGFDENFGSLSKSLMFEEIDLTYRIWLEGYELLLDISTEMWHLRSPEARRFGYNDTEERDKARQINTDYFVDKLFKTERKKK